MVPRNECIHIKCVPLNAGIEWNGGKTGRWSLQQSYPTERTVDGRALMVCRIIHPLPAIRYLRMAASSESGLPEALLPSWTLQAS